MGKTKLLQTVRLAYVFLLSLLEVPLRDKRNQLLRIRLALANQLNDL